MWLFNSSIGRKLIMAITGACLVLFVTFHVLMNSVALIWPTAYNQVCEFLGANWYALVASAGLAFLFIVHIIYAVILTVQNRKARGNDRYAVTSRPPQVEWASKNMLVLGIVIVAFLVVHLIQFWAKMQWQELRHADLSVLPMLEGGVVEPAQGTLFIQMAFSEVWTPIVYIIGFIALWFHMNHGFWSMFQSTGWNNQSWLPRLKKVAAWWTTIVIALFVAQAIVFTVHAHNKYYLLNPELQAQYVENYDDQASELYDSFENQTQSFFNDLRDQVNMYDPSAQTVVEQKQKEFLEKEGVDFLKAAHVIIWTYQNRAPELAKQSANLQKLKATYDQIRTVSQSMGVELPKDITEDNNNQK